MVVSGATPAKSLVAWEGTIPRRCWESYGRSERAGYHTDAGDQAAFEGGMMTILLVGVGGFVGANIRYGIAAWSVRRHGQHFPIGTLIANLTGSLLMGLILGLIDDRELRLLLASGFLGAETTFSTFAVETVMLADGGRG